MNLLCSIFMCDWETKTIIKRLESTNPIELAHNKYPQCKQCRKTMGLLKELKCHI